MNSKKPEVLVVGAGLAGLMAALTAVSEGCQVRIVAKGTGTLAISSACIDLLGYASGQRLDNPWEAIGTLPPTHPYRLVGEKGIQTALELFSRVLAAQNWPYRASASRENVLLPTMVGTLKPSYLLPASVDTEALATAQRVLVLGIEGLREASPTLVVNGLRQYPDWAQRQLEGAVLPSPLKGVHRSPNTLDLARFVDRTEGRAWLAQQLASHAGKADLILLPPICGSEPDPALYQELTRTAQAPLVELLSIPPGVGGLRLWQALRNALNQTEGDGKPATVWLENAMATDITVTQSRCSAMTIKAVGGAYSLPVTSCVIATGGILGGGVEMTAGKVRETVCDIPVNAPDNVEQWSHPAIFDAHPYASFGVSVDNNMRATARTMHNVFFAGRTIGGYDYATEKSGHGVALATGWRAGYMAAQVALASGGNS